MANENVSKSKNGKLQIMNIKYIELNTFLKVMKIANTGGEAKHIIRSRNIMVNGEIETRNRKKLLTGAVVTYAGRKFAVLPIHVR